MNVRAPMNQYDSWKINQIEHWIQIQQIPLDLKTLSNDLFPGYVPMTERGEKWKSSNPMMCTMVPDFATLSNRIELRNWHQELIEKAISEKMIGRHWNVPPAPWELQNWRQKLLEQEKRNAILAARSRRNRLKNVERKDKRRKRRRNRHAQKQKGSKSKDFVSKIQSMLKFPRKLIIVMSMVLLALFASSIWTGISKPTQT